MVPEKKILNPKHISLAKAVLAILWKIKEIGKDDLFDQGYIKLLCQNKHKTTYRTCISRLYRQNLIKKEDNDIISLTEKGEKIALTAFVEAESAIYRNHPQELWDGGWRMIFFDIPEEKRKYRDYLRRLLVSVGFQELQRSIWIYPYPVPPFLKELLFEKNLRPHIRFVTTASIDGHENLKELFDL